MNYSRLLNKITSIGSGESDRCALTALFSTLSSDQKPRPCAVVLSNVQTPAAKKVTTETRITASLLRCTQKKSKVSELRVRVAVCGF